MNKEKFEAVKGPFAKRYDIEIGPGANKHGDILFRLDNSIVIIQVEDLYKLIKDIYEKESGWMESWKSFKMLFANLFVRYFIQAESSKEGRTQMITIEKINELLAVTFAELDKEIAIMQDYLKMRLSMGDLHGIRDSAADEEQLHAKKDALKVFVQDLLATSGDKDGS